MASLNGSVVGSIQLTGRPSAAAAWAGLVSPKDVVGLKVYSAPGPVIGTRPAVVAAVVEGLRAAGLPGSNIVIWDKNPAHLEAAGFYALARQLGVRAASAQDEGWDDKTAYSSAFLGQLVAGDLEFQKTGDTVGRRSFLSKLLTRQLTRIILISPLLNHYSSGVAGNLYSLASGSVDNFIRFEHDTGRLAQAVPEIYALPELGDRVVLSIVDALVCQYEGEHEMRLHYAAALNQLRLSRDPVALDVLSVDELSGLRQRRGLPTTSSTNALTLYHNASLVEIGVSALERVHVERVRP